MNRLILTLALFLTFAYHCTANASVLVDFSPNATSTETYLNWGTYLERVDAPTHQIIAARFEWNGGWITGGSIFSANLPGFGQLGESVRFMIWDEAAEGAYPIFQQTTFIDAVDKQDSTYDTRPGYDTWRKHASISGVYLAAGTYYFGLPGDGITAGHASGFMGNDEMYVSQSPDSDFDLELFTANLGTPFFQIEGYSAVPEPASIAIWSALGLGACGLMGFGRRKARAAVQA